MEEKKTLTEEELDELSEKQLRKITGGCSQGDICPNCGKATLVNDPYYNYVRCPICHYEEGDSRSR